MGKIDKILEKMRTNPKDWRIENLKTIAKRYGLEFRQPGTSHVTFRCPNQQKLTVPTHRPIKPIYVKKFLELIDELKGDKK